MVQANPSKPRKSQVASVKTTKRRSSKSNISKAKRPQTADHEPRRRDLNTWLLARVARLRRRQKAFMSRRPHRSFKRTMRRDYRRSLKLPGYNAFTLHVFAELKRHWRTFLLLVAAYATMTIILGGVTSQDSFTQISDLLEESSTTLASGGVDKLGQAGLLLVATFASGPSDLSADQQIYLAILLLFAWLSTVWLHREYKLGRKPKLRDGLYNSGAPFFSTLFVLFVFICQLIPLGVVALMHAGLSSVGIIGEGFGSMIFWVFAAIVAALVLYWVTSTTIALVVVTLPGMYPMRAIRASSDLVVSRRLRIMYRLLWMLGSVGVAWAVVMIPLILLVTWLTGMWPGVSSIPIMPFAVALMSACTVVWVSSYVYILYRKVVDDDAAPA